jgi:hypothetical protein
VVFAPTLLLTQTGSQGRPPGGGHVLGASFSSARDRDAGCDGSLIFVARTAGGHLRKKRTFVGHVVVCPQACQLAAPVRARSSGLRFLQYRFRPQDGDARFEHFRGIQFQRQQKPRAALRCCGPRGPRRIRSARQTAGPLLAVEFLGRKGRYHATEAFASVTRSQTSTPHFCGAGFQRRREPDLSLPYP